MASETTCDSETYRHTFYGILNAQGEFWTPLAFDSEKTARDHIERFWTDNRSRALFLSKCQIVPVRVHLSTLPKEPSA